MTDNWSGSDVNICAEWRRQLCLLRDPWVDSGLSGQTQTKDEPSSGGVGEPGKGFEMKRL